ncbi:MAG TPA: Na+/H+ antiporter [Anaerolineae bacterium]|nr:Na+/H+ antiporter [Anaerolineae bacterium]HID85489.1 Na+/H+ antiporter [Anaerolineales bacterium]HIQ07975.1 Na+/H+ antiporter [Anaerolineaceae bacterium]
MDELNLLLVLEVTIGLLLVAVLVGLAARRLRVPYTLGLVLVGLGLAIFARLDIPLTADLVLGLLIPPLIFEAAFHLRADALRKDLAPILTLAVPGVVLTTLVVGSIMHYFAGLPLPIAMLFGALVAATDPVAVVTLFRRLGVPKRMQVLLEGESLLNDGTAIVVFNLVLAVILTGQFNLFQSVVDFLRVAGGGLLVGGLLGALISGIIARVDDYLLETALTVVLAYGAYLVAEQLHVSGVLAVVAAGLLNGNIGPKGMSPTTRIVVTNFWETGSFFANTFVFLLIGLQVNLPLIWENLVLIGWAILAVLVSRALDVYGLAWVGDRIPFRWLHILYWGGLRGAISLALAVALPSLLGPDGVLVQVMAFGVVLFTLLVQGSTIGMLIRKLNIIERDEQQVLYEERHARAVSTRTAYQHLKNLYQDGLISEHSWRILRPLLEQRSRSLQSLVHELLRRHPELALKDLRNARLEALRAQRSALMQLLQNGVITEETFSRLAAEVDEALALELPPWPGSLLRRSAEEPPIRHLALAIIQEQDFENAAEAMAKLGVPVTVLPSTGGFLQRRNLTLMLGIPEGQVEDVIQALQASCRRRVEFVAEGAARGLPLPLPRPKAVTIGGATVFLFPVEHYEEI